MLCLRKNQATVQPMKTHLILPRTKATFKGYHPPLSNICRCSEPLAWRRNQTLMIAKRKRRRHPGRRRVPQTLVTRKARRSPRRGTLQMRVRGNQRKRKAPARCARRGGSHQAGAASAARAEDGAAAVGVAARVAAAAGGRDVAPAADVAADGAASEAHRGAVP